MKTKTQQKYEKRKQDCYNKSISDLNKMLDEYKEKWGKDFEKKYQKVLKDELETNTDYMINVEIGKALSEQAEELSHEPKTERIMTLTAENIVLQEQLQAQKEKFEEVLESIIQEIYTWWWGDNKPLQERLFDLIEKKKEALNNQTLSNEGSTPSQAMPVGLTERTDTMASSGWNSPKEGKKDRGSNICENCGHQEIAHNPCGAREDFECKFMSWKSPIYCSCQKFTPQKVGEKK